MFSSAKLEKIPVTLSPNMINCCIFVAKKNCEEAGLKYTRDSLIHDIVECLDSNEENEIFYSREISILSNEFMEYKKVTKQWRMQISQIRKSNKVGRNIRSRIITSIKHE